MSTSQSQSSGGAASSVNQQQVLSHLVDALMAKNGGRISVEQLMLHAGDFLSNPDIDGLLSNGEQNGVYSRSVKQNGEEVIESVTPVDDRPDAIEKAFPELYGGSADSDDESEALDLTDLDGVAKALSSNLSDNGYESVADIAQAEASELATVPQITRGRAESLIKEAQTHVDTSQQWLDEVLAPYRERGPDASSQVMALSATDQEVGAPLAVVKPDIDPDDAHVLGLPILEDVGHPDVPDVSEMVEPGEVADPYTDQPVIERMAAILRNPSYGLLVVGPPGSGKNTRAKWLHGQANRPYVQIDMTEDKRDMDFLGVKTVTDEAVVAHEDSELTRLAKNGGTICINEWNIGRESVRMMFQTILADRQLTVTPAREVIKVHPEFRLMVTQNPISRENRGTNPVNRANLGRFRAVYCPYLDSEDEVNLLDSKFNDDRTKVKRETLRNLVEAATQTRNENNGPTLSTRDLEAIVADIDTGVDPLMAIRARLNQLQLSQPYNDPEAAWELITPVFD